MRLASEARSGDASIPQGADRPRRRRQRPGSAPPCSSPCSRSGGRRAPNSTTPTTDRRPTGSPSLPRDYGDLPRGVPKLGPPLPGDLGRPILNAGAPAPGMPMSASNAEEQRAAQEQEAALTSHLFATTSLRQDIGAIAPTLPAVRQRERHRPPPPAAAGSTDPVSQDHKLAFLNGNVDRRTTSPGSRAAGREPLRLAGRLGHPGGADHRPAFRSSGRGDRPGDRGCLRQSDRQDASDPAGRASDRPVRRAGRLRPDARPPRLESPDHAERPLDRARASAGHRPRGLRRPRRRGRQSLGHAVQGGHPLDAPQHRVRSRRERQRECARAGPPTGLVARVQPGRRTGSSDAP